MPNSPHRKKVKHFHEPGDFHELTFSCYQRMQLLTNDRWRLHLARSIDDAIEAEQFRLVAFVFMPEHVHLLVFPTRNDTTADRISAFLFAAKVPCSQRVKEDLEESNSRLLTTLSVRHGGRTVFHFWQAGPGYDRNLQTPKALMAAIDYIHMNPVRRGLCDTIVEWRWSSARWYTSDGQHFDPALPKIHGPPPGFFTA
jgi:putative transposase